MFSNILSRERQRLLELLGQKHIIDGFYLAGGTAAALYLGHRISEDFDFFSMSEFNNAQIIRNLSVVGNFILTGEGRGTVHGLLNETKVSFLHYQYPLLYDKNNFLGCETASLIDIALMKITAVSGRGSKKDFVDLYFICNEIISFIELLKLFDKKYSDTGYSKYHLLKSLGYFDDADSEPDPIMLKQAEWNNVKKYFVKLQDELFINVYL